MRCTCPKQARTIGHNWFLRLVPGIRRTCMAAPSPVFIGGGGRRGGGAGGGGSGGDRGGEGEGTGGGGGDARGRARAAQGEGLRPSVLLNLRIHGYIRGFREF